MVSTNPCCRRLSDGGHEVCALSLDAGAHPTHAAADAPRAGCVCNLIAQLGLLVIRQKRVVRLQLKDEVERPGCVSEVVGQEVETYVKSWRPTHLMSAARMGKGFGREKGPVTAAMQCRTRV